MAKRRSRKRTQRETKVVDDYGTSERGQHMGGLEKEVRERSGTGQAVSFGMRAKAECKLDAYWNRMMLTWRQYSAGMVMRRLYLNSYMQPRVTGSYGERIAGTGDWLAGCNDAKKKLLDAVQTLPANPLNMKGPVMLVCCDDDWAGGTRKLQALRQGLDRLADYFQIRDIEAA
jgi:hypothetical protein